jgi:hypothetical protein
MPAYLQRSVLTRCIALLVCFAGLLSSAFAQLTSGWTNVPYQFLIQSPHTLPMWDRYDYEPSTKTHTFMVRSSDSSHFPESSGSGPRTEMKVLGYNYRNVGRHQFEAEFNISPGTDATCFFQIKGGEGGNTGSSTNTFLMLRVYGNEVTNYQSPLKTIVKGQWYKLNVIHDAANGPIEVWIDDVKELTVTGNSVADDDHYFKAGVYNQSGAASVNEVKFRNVKMWQQYDSGKQMQTITFPALPSSLPVGSTYQLNASSTSGLPIRYLTSYEPYVTFSGSTLNAVGSGYADIMATQPGNGSYNMATNVMQYLITTSSSKQTQTINIPSIPVKQVGDPDFSTGASASSGLPLRVYSSNLAVATVVRNNVIHIEGPGTTTLTFLQPGNGTYNGAVVYRTLTVTDEEPAAAPAFNPPAGTYSSAQSVALSSTTPGATIRFTLDGSNPTATTGTVYSGPIAVNSTTTVKAIATASGFVDSPVSSATYTITQPAAAAPTFSPGSGTYTTAQSVTLSTSTPGATIRYTTNGTNPTATTGTVYSSPIAVSSTTTLKAIATASGYSASAVSSATYDFATPPTGPVTLEAETLSYITSGPAITTGNETAASGGVITYFNTPSANQYVEYTTPSLPAGTYSLQFRYKANANRGQHTVVVNGTQIGGTINQYATSSAYTSTTLGTVTFASTGPQIIRLTVTGKVAASGSFHIAPDAFTLTPQASQVATPTFSPASGTFTSPVSVSLATATSGATIRYTLDGSTPTATTGTVYSSPLTISTTTTVKAIAYLSGSTNSSVAQATYTIATAAPNYAWEPEALTYVSGTTTTNEPADTLASGGAWVSLHSDSAGDFIEFTLPTAVAGTYQLQLRYKGETSRGRCTVTVNGATVGGTVDQYATGPSYTTVTIGNVTLPAGSSKLRLTVSGKNTASSDYRLSADRILLNGQ